MDYRNEDFGHVDDQDTRDLLAGKWSIELLNIPCDVIIAREDALNDAMTEWYDNDDAEAATVALARFWRV